ncbi:MAG: response regulator [Defluviitaleaceae bacterium]|nr:response regulator [Defluviitaleaceae bacterium]
MTINQSIPEKSKNKSIAGHTEPEFIASCARVLVIDDMRTNLAVIEAMLDSFDIQPDLASDGTTAISLAQNIQYDLILTDYMMPKMDGIETARHIRAIKGKNGEMPIIALTSNISEQAEKMFLSHGFNAVLPKPMGYDILNICLRKWLPAHLIKEI